MISSASLAHRWRATGRAMRALRAVLICSSMSPARLSACGTARYCASTPNFALKIAALAAGAGPCHAAVPECRIRGSAIGRGAGCHHGFGAHPSGRLCRDYRDAIRSRRPHRRLLGRLLVSGPHNPHSGRIGVVAEGALADLLLVDGDPTADIRLLEDPARNFLIIMKDGRIYKNTMQPL